MILFSTKTLRILTLGARDISGLALFPFIILHENLRESSELELTINHERIHLRQQAEMLFLPFILFYVLNYLYFRIRGQSHRDAYMSIIFEREAYRYMYDMSYLDNRKFLAWLRMD